MGKYYNVNMTPRDRFLIKYTSDVSNPVSIDIRVRNNGKFVYTQKISLIDKAMDEINEQFVLMDVDFDAIIKNKRTGKKVRETCQTLKRITNKVSNQMWNNYKAVKNKANKDAENVINALNVSQRTMDDVVGKLDSISNEEI